MPLMQVLTISWSLKQYGLLYSKVPRKLASAFMGTLGLSDVYLLWPDKLAKEFLRLGDIV